MRVEKVFVSDDGVKFDNEQHALEREKIMHAKFLAYEAQQEAERLTQIHEDMVEDCDHPIVEVRNLGEIFVTCLICDNVSACSGKEQLKRNFGNSKQVIIR